MTGVEAAREILMADQAPAAPEPTAAPPAPEAPATAPPADGAPPPTLETPAPNPETPEATTETPVEAPPDLEPQDAGPPEDLAPLPFDEAFADVELTEEERAKIDAALALDPADPKRNERIIGAYQETSRGSKLYSNLKAMRDWQAEFGKLPTAEDIKAFRELQVDTKVMENHFAHGTPQEQAQWWQHWFVDRQTGKLHQGAPQMLEHLPQTIYSASPEAYESTEKAFAKQIVDYAKANAMQAPSEQARGAWKAIYENMQFAYLTPGKFDPLEGGDAPPNGQSNGHSNGHANGTHVPPDVQQRLDQLERERTERLRADAHRVHGEFQNKESQGMEDVIGRVVFGPQKNGQSWEPSPTEKRAHTLALREEIGRALSSNRHFLAEYDIARQNALRSGNPQQWEEAVGLYKAAAERALRTRVWPEYVKGLKRPSADLKAQSEERHQVQRAAQAQTQPGAGGAPVPAAAANAIERQKGENDRQYATRFAQQLLSTPG